MGTAVSVPATITECSMPRIFVRHTVRDYAAWRLAFDAHEAIRTAAGLHDGRVYRSADAPNDVLVVLEADDLDRARQFGGDPAVRTAMSAAGVLGAPEVDVAP